MDPPDETQQKMDLLPGNEFKKKIPFSDMTLQKVLDFFGRHAVHRTPKQSKTKRVSRDARKKTSDDRTEHCSEKDQDKLLHVTDLLGLKYGPNSRQGAKVRYDIAKTLNVVKGRSKKSKRYWYCYLSNVVRNRRRFREKARNDYSLSNAIFNNGERSHYQLLEYVVYREAKALHEDVSVNAALAQSIVKACLNRLGDNYRSSVGLENDRLPDPRWTEKVFKRAGFAWRREEGERDLVDDIVVTEMIMKIWDTIIKYPSDRIFNADQTSVQMRAAFSERVLTKKGAVSKRGKRVGSSYTLFPSVSASGTVKLAAFFYSNALVSQELRRLQAHLNPADVPAPLPELEQFERDKRSVARDVNRDPEVMRLAAILTGLRGECNLRYKEKNAAKGLKDVAKKDISCSREDRMRLEAEHRELNIQHKSLVAQCTAAQNQLEAAKDVVSARLIAEKRADPREPTVAPPMINRDPHPESSNPNVLYDKDFRLPKVRPESKDLPELRKLEEEYRKLARTPGTTAEDKKRKNEELNPYFYRVAQDFMSYRNWTGPEHLMECYSLKQKKGYMDTVMMVIWLYYFAIETKAKEDDRVLLILDNVGFHHAAHQVVKDWDEMKGVDFLFLPKNSTSYTQPMDLGIIATLKQRCRQLEQRYLASLTTTDGSRPLVAALHRMNWYIKVWEEMDPETIRHAFGHSPLFFPHTGVPLPRKIEPLVKKWVEGGCRMTPATADATAPANAAVSAVDGVDHEEDVADVFDFEDEEDDDEDEYEDEDPITGETVLDAIRTKSLAELLGRQDATFIVSDHVQARNDHKQSEKYERQRTNMATYTANYNRRVAEAQALDNMEELYTKLGFPRGTHAEVAAYIARRNEEEAAELPAEDIDAQASAIDLVRNAIDGFNHAEGADDVILQAQEVGDDTESTEGSVFDGAEPDSMNTDLTENSIHCEVSRDSQGRHALGDITDEILNVNAINSCSTPNKQSQTPGHRFTSVNPVFIQEFGGAPPPIEIHSDDDAEVPDDGEAVVVGDDVQADGGVAVEALPAQTRKRPPSRRAAYHGVKRRNIDLGCDMRVESFP